MSGSILHPTFTQFPDGQPHVIASVIAPNGAHYKIAHQPRSSSEIFGVALYADVLRHRGAASLDWICPLIPWSRMDRRMSENEPHSMQVMAKFINSLEFDCVYTVTPHSDVCEALIDNLTILHPYRTFLARLQQEKGVDLENVLLVAPDVGAVKRTQYVANLLQEDAPIAILHKERFNRVVKMGIIHQPPVKDESTQIIVVDDLLDGGATFLHAAPILRRVYGERPLHLMVAHGLFSDYRNLTVLQELYDTISFLDHSFMQSADVDLTKPQQTLLPLPTFPWISAQI